MHRVAVLALEGVVPFELAMPAQIFGQAVDDQGKALYDVVTCTLDGRPVRTAADFRVAVGHDASALAGADTIVVPAANGRANVACEAGLMPPASRCGSAAS